VTGRSHVLRPRGPDRRRTRAGAATERRIWKCGACRRQFSVLVGTILQGTRIDLWIWVDLVRDWSVGRSLPPAGEIGARYGLSSETARQVRARLLAAVDHEPARAVHARMASPAR
jgi:ribosomal protein L37AE/L43A